jgi:hypothetical protein
VAILYGDGDEIPVTMDCIGVELAAYLDEEITATGRFEVDDQGDRWLTVTKYKLRGRRPRDRYEDTWRIEDDEELDWDTRQLIRQVGAARSR